MISQLDPNDFSVWRDSAQSQADGVLPLVLDVREPWEVQTASVKADGFTLLHIAMRDIPERLAELKLAHGHDRPIACLCHHGMRSLQAAGYLAENGFTQVVNLRGGINAWTQQVDPSVPAY